MSQEIVKFNVNNVMPLEYLSDIKEEFHDEYCSDNKLYISETTITDTINISNTEINEYIKNEKIGKCGILSVDHIKTDLPSSEVNNTISNHLKIEDGICSASIQVEFDNKMLLCNHCQEIYQDYCTKCRVLVHILNERPCHNNRIRELPKYMLEARESIGHLGIFSLKVIPENVRFGPFTGLNSTGPLRIKGGKFVVSDVKSEHRNWMQYVNPAKNIYEQNLFPFQYDDKLYYYSTCRIQKGEELLVYFGEEYKDNLHENVEIDFVPIAKKDVENVFACTFCCLGFSSKDYLAEHKAVSHSEGKEVFSVEELAQCPFCKIYLEAKEYFEYHMDYCYETSDGYCVVPTPEVRELEVESRSYENHEAKKWKRGIYKCTEECNFRTIYSADFSHHTNDHYQVEMYKCGIHKTQESLQTLLVKNHVNNDEIGIQNYTTKHLKENSCKCMGCGYETKYRSSLKRHIEEKHLKQKDYKCAECEYKTNRKTRLKEHIEVKHLKRKDNKCIECEYVGSRKSDLEKHIKVKHLKQNHYKCTECEFKTCYKSSLEAHIKAKHLKENDYKCAECEFQTSVKSHLKIHIKAKHRKDSEYRCTECEYMTNYKSDLEKHIKTKHLNENDYKCTGCEYMTNYKSDLEKHIKAKHLKENDYKCTDCEFKTCYKSSLDKHTKAKHLKDNEYKCMECDFKTYYKSNLEAHAKAKHLKDNEYNCMECDFKTYYKLSFEKHINRHLETPV